MLLYMSVRKICVFLFVNCVFIFRIANTFVTSHAMKYSEFFFRHSDIFGLHLPPPPPPPTIHASYGAESRTLIRRTNPAGNLVYQNTAHFIPLHSYSSELNYGRSAIIAFSSLTFLHNCSTLLSPSRRREAPCEGTNSPRLFTPGETKALAKSKVHQISRA